MRARALSGGPPELRPVVGEVGGVMPDVTGQPLNFPAGPTARIIRACQPRK